MVAPLNLESIQSALASQNGWLEVGAILACFAVGWAIDRRLHVSSHGESKMAKLGAGSVNRLVFPLTTLVLLLLVRGAVPQFHTSPFFPIAIPLVIALAVIRLCVYALRNLFGENNPLPLSERAVSFTIWGLLLLYFLGITQEILGILEAAELTIGRSTINLRDLGRDAVIVMLALMISLWISGLIEQWILAMPNVDRNARVVMAKFFKAVLLVVGVLISLPLLGIDLTVLSVFGGALGVGIGLGLQKLASNYIAGFTILLDRSIRLGDMITVDNRFGVVTKLTSRYVVVRSLDGIEAIVPNETLATTTVLNHSYSSRNARVALTLQISYDSDLDLAMRLVNQIARDQPRVLNAPNPPAVTVLRFAESGIDLELAVWISDPENGQGELRSAMYVAIWKAFGTQGIKIPYPRRDIRVLDLGNPTSAPPEGQQNSAH
jgi:small-conductance mechanosensitive channel